MRHSMPSEQRGDRRPSPLQQPGQRRVYYRQKCLGMAIQALPQGGTGRYGAQPKGLGEEGIPAKPLNGLKVALALTGQTQFRDQDTAVGYGAAHREARIDELTQSRESDHSLAN